MNFKLTSVVYLNEVKLLIGPSYILAELVMNDGSLVSRKRKHGELIGKYPEHACAHCSKKFWQPKELKTHIDREHNR